MPSRDALTRMTAAQRVRLLRVVAALAPLHMWEPVGSMLEEIRLALHDDTMHGLSEHEFARAVLWASRWLALDTRLRALYAREAASCDLGVGSPVHAALWSVLDATSTIPSGALYGAMRSLWVAHYGYPPPIELIPTTLDTRTRR